MLGAVIVAAANGLPRRPRLRGYLRELPGDGRTTVLRGGGTSVTLRGRSVEEVLDDLLPRLTGQHTVDELAAELPHITPDVIIGALGVLNEQRLLDDAEGLEELSPGNSPQRNYWRSLGLDPDEVETRLETARVVLVGPGAVGEAVFESLTSSSVGAVRVFTEVPLSQDDASSMLEGCQLAVVALDYAVERSLTVFNQAAVRLNLPWLSVTLGASNNATVGPFVVPRETACYECFRCRLASNRSYLDDAIGRYPGAASPDSQPILSLAYPGFLAHITAQLAVSEVLRFLAGFAPPTTFGAFLSLNPQVATIVRHDLLKLPRCPACGPGRYHPQPMIWDLPGSEPSGESHES